LFYASQPNHGAPQNQREYSEFFPLILARHPVASESFISAIRAEIRSSFADFLLRSASIYAICTEPPKTTKLLFVN
jgi:hypothetical protein